MSEAIDPKEVQAQRTRLDELCAAVHQYRNSPGLEHMRALLAELERSILKAMVTGSKETFDSAKGQYTIVARLIATIDTGPRKFDSDQVAR